MSNQETQIMIKLSNEDKEIIKKAAKLKGLGHSTFAKSVVLEESRRLILNLSN